MTREFIIVIERDSEGFYVASVPALPGCHTQAKTREDLDVRIREAIAVCIEERGRDVPALELISVERVTVAA